LINIGIVGNFCFSHYTTVYSPKISKMGLF
jgi:hypothetical protein